MTLQRTLQRGGDSGTPFWVPGWNLNKQSVFITALGIFRSYLSYAHWLNLIWESFQGISLAAQILESERDLTRFKFTRLATLSEKVKVEIFACTH